MTKPVAPEVDLIDLDELEDALRWGAMPMKSARALIAETRAHRAAIESLGGIEFAKAEAGHLYQLREALMPHALEADGMPEAPLEVIARLAGAHRAAKLPPVGVVTAEKFWQMLDGEIEKNEEGGVYLGGHAVALIEARDAAIRAALTLPAMAVQIWCCEACDELELERRDIEQGEDANCASCGGHARLVMYAPVAVAAKSPAGVGVGEALEAVKFLGIAATCDKCDPETAHRVGLALDDVRSALERVAREGGGELLQEW